MSAAGVQIIVRYSSWYSIMDKDEIEAVLSLASVVVCYILSDYPKTLK